MIDLLIKYPTRQRPNEFKRILSSYINKLSGKYNVKFIISLDENDSASNTDDIRNFLNNAKNQVNLDYIYGSSRNKIDACNRDIPSDGWKVSVLISDDMVPEQHGYDEIIMRDMNRHFPQLDGTLNYNCGSAFPRVMVLSVMGNEHYKKFGYIYHPDYVSLYCDEEQTNVARNMNKMVDINTRVIVHDWVNIKDDLRKNTESFHPIDKVTFESRKQRGYPR